MKRTPAGVSTLVTLVLVGASGAVAQEIQDPCAPIAGVNDRCPTWAASYGSGPAVDDVPQDVVVSPDGQTVVTLGSSMTVATDVDVKVVASDAATGAQRWIASQSAQGTSLDTPSGIVVSPDGSRVLVAGSTCESPAAPDTCDMVVTSLDITSGAKAWEVRLDGSGGSQDTAAASAVAPGGDTVYLAGLEAHAATGADAVVLALDAADGSLRWSSSYDAARGFDAAHGIAVSENGERIYVTGPSESPATGKDFVTIAFDAQDGQRLWVARRDDHGGGDQPTGIVAGDGRVIVTGTTDEGIAGLSADYATVGYDALSGEVIWEALYNGGTLDLPLDISMGADRVFVTGMSRGTSSGYDMATVAYDTETGTQGWAMRFNGLANNGDAAWSVEASPDGETAYVSGDTLLPGGVDYAHAVIAYDADDGAVRWTGLHRGGGPQGGSLRQGLDVSPDGTRVYYTGSVLAPTTDADFLTLAYAG